MKRVALHTLGCKLNFTETSSIGRQFTGRGYEVVDIDQPAGVCVINTCSVTERADRECRQIVRRALRHSPEAYIIVIGCYAQLQPEEIASIPGVDLVLGAREKFELFDHARGFEKSSGPRIAVSPIDEVDNFGTASSIGYEDRTRAFLKIQDGCDYTCAFCTIPLARGASRSLTVNATVAQASEVVAAGYKEIVLTGVNVGDYGKKIDTDLLALLRQLVGIDGLERIRVSSIEPNLLTDTLLGFWLEHPKLCKHFHIPLQSGSDDLLKGMRRRYLTEWYAERVHAIKAARPGAGIGADVIVGFPGESDDAFEETYRFLVELPLSYLHVFTYSERPNTPAALFPNQVEPRVRFQRSERLRILSSKKRRTFYESFSGREVEVLFEGEKERGWMTGLSGEYVRVNIPTDLNLVNQVRKVTIQHIQTEACIGELIDTSLYPHDVRFEPSNEVTLCVP
ncbi:MAG: tRNA (N(6)-L-threonylcarbamoyladenosine(37)-C(2))-methylthiotransferase MtaB [Ignavibacteriales bacterium]|nr:tRNA (N(6)-L-threonylcarbamoyladenosine(37)-C(2))-methylthiotransferase MtaB [Ignavibacteriales bacterium]